MGQPHSSEVVCGVSLSRLLLLTRSRFIYTCVLLTRLYSRSLRRIWDRLAPLGQHGRTFAGKRDGDG